MQLLDMQRMCIDCSSSSVNNSWSKILPSQTNSYRCQSSCHWLSFPARETSSILLRLNIFSFHWDHPSVFLYSKLLLFPSSGTASLIIPHNIIFSTFFNPSPPIPIINLFICTLLKAKPWYPWVAAPKNAWFYWCAFSEVLHKYSKTSLFVYSNH